MPFLRRVSAWQDLPLRHICIRFLSLLLLLPNAAVQAEGEPLTLATALSRAMAQNPELHAFELRLKELEGSRLTANQAPAYEAELEVENALGSGDLRGADQAEYTLSLSSIIELGGKRQARRGAANSRYDLVTAEREAETLDLLGQVTRHYLATLALQEKLKLAAQSIDLSELTLNTVKRRAAQGASPDAEVLRAQAALTQNQIAQSALQVEYEKRKVVLASTWGETRVDFQWLQGNLYQFEPSEPSQSFDLLYQQASASPAIQIYASEKRLREAEVQLARSQAKSDIRWRIGARHFEETGDIGLVAGVSVPLFAGRRHRGEVQTATAARDEVKYREKSALLQLHSLLFDAYHTRQHNIDAAERIRSTVLPDLSKALELTRQAYERGRYSYQEWVAAQRELLSAREALIDTAASALLSQALIEQLTAQPMNARVAHTSQLIQDY